MIVNIALLFIIAVICASWFVMEKYAYFRNRGIPYMRPTFPLGNLRDVGKSVDVYTWQKQLYSYFRDKDVIGGVFYGTVPTVVVTDLEVAKDILVRDFAKFSDHGIYTNEDTDPLSVNLFAMEGEKWRNLRTKISPTFSMNKMRTMLPVMSSVGENLIAFVDRFVDQNEPFNAKDLALRFVLDSIGSCTFGIEFNTLRDSDSILLKYGSKLFPPNRHQLLRLLLINSYRPLARLLRIKVFPSELARYFADIIKDSEETRERDNVQKDDFMNLLIQIKKSGCLREDESGEIIGQISDNELAAQAFIIFFAGLHPTRIILAFTLFELALHQEIQQKAREEVQSKMVDGQVTFEALTEMVYLQQIIDETLRKHPPMGIIMRRANANYNVRNSHHVIEKGMKIIIPMVGIQHDPTIYPDPCRFDPDRMTTEQMNLRHSSAFMPFGAGPRICIGLRFGYLQIKMALAMLLVKFRFTINSKTKQPLSMDPANCKIDLTTGIWIDSHRI